MPSRSEVIRLLFQLEVEDREAIRRLLNDELSPTEENENARAAWTAELERRVRAIESGEEQTIPWEVVQERLEAHFGRQALETGHADSILSRCDLGR
jgi:putative addiction module component (TIGR02574 family)